MKRKSLKLLIGVVVGAGIVGIIIFYFSMKKISLTTKAFSSGGDIPSVYTCDGENKNPQLEVSDVPENAVSLALTMEDPDSPTGLWVHWLTWNISPQTRVIGEGIEPSGVSGKGTAGNSTYKGPCPASGRHRYYFKIYALDTELDLASGSSLEEFSRAIAGHVIGKGEIMGTYARVK